MRVRVRVRRTLFSERVAALPQTDSWKGVGPMAQGRDLPEEMKTRAAVVLSLERPPRGPAGGRTRASGSHGRRGVPAPSRAGCCLKSPRVPWPCLLRPRTGLFNNQSEQSRARPTAEHHCLVWGGLWLSEAGERGGSIRSQPSAVVPARVSTQALPEFDLLGSI